MTETTALLSVLFSMFSCSLLFPTGFVLTFLPPHVFLVQCLIHLNLWIHHSDTFRYIQIMCFSLSLNLLVSSRGTILGERLGDNVPM